MIKQHKYRLKAAVHSKLDCSRRKQQTCRSVCSQCTLFLFICISICLEQNICSFSITYLYSATSGLYMRLCPRNTASRIYSNRGIDFFPKSTVTSRYCQLQVENEPLRKKKEAFLFVSLCFGRTTLFAHGLRCNIVHGLEILDTLQSRRSQTNGFSTKNRPGAYIPTPAGWKKIVRLHRLNTLLS